MEDIKELIKKRDEISAKIREIQEMQRICGCVKYEKFVGWGIDNGLQISVKTFAPENHERWRSIIVGETKDDVITGIDTMIKDLRTMKKRLEKM